MAVRLRHANAWVCRRALGCRQPILLLEDRVQSGVKILLLLLLLGLEVLVAQVLAQLALGERAREFGFSPLVLLITVESLRFVELVLHGG